MHNLDESNKSRAWPKGSVSEFTNSFVIGTWYLYGAYAVVAGVFAGWFNAILYFTVAGAIACGVIGLIGNFVEEHYLRFTRPILLKTGPNRLLMSVVTLGWLIIYATEIIWTVYSGAQIAMVPLR